MYNFQLTYGNDSYFIPPDKEPIGWADLTLSLERHNEYHGFFSDYGIDLKFRCGGGYEFIQAAYNAEGTEAQVFVSINYDCGDGNGFKPVFSGALNLMTADWDIGLGLVGVAIERGDLETVFLSRQETAVNLFSLNSLDNPAPNPADLPVEPFAPYELQFEDRPLVLESRWTGDDGVLCCYTWDDLINEADTPPYDPFYGYVFDTQLFNQLNEFTEGVNVDCGLPVRVTDPSTNANPFPFIGNSTSFHLSTESGEGTLCINGCFRLTMSGYWDGGNPTVAVAADIRATFGYVVVEPDNVTTNYFPLYDSGYVYPLVSPLSQSTTALTCCDVLKDNGTDPPNVAVFDANIALNIPFTFAVGRRIALVWTLQNQWSIPVFQNPPESANPFVLCVQTGNCSDVFVGVTINSQFGDSVAKVFAVHESFRRILKSICTPAADIISTYFGRTNSAPSYAENGCGGCTVLANGYMLRGATIESIEDAPDTCEGGGTVTVKPVELWLSFKQLFDAMDSIFSIGAGLESIGNGLFRMRIEYKSYFYNNTVILTFANLDAYQAKFKIKPNMQLHYNNVQIGYQEWQPNFVNGVLEYNSNRTYTTNAKRAQETLDKTTDFIASDGLIEWTRRQQVTELGTTDTDYDDSVFVIATKREEPDFMVKCEVGIPAPAVNVPNPTTARNWRLSPFANLYRWSKWLLSAYSKLVYSGGEGNTNAGGGDLNNDINCIIPQHSENQNIDFYERIVSPQIAELSVPLTWSEYELVKANPYGRVLVAVNGESTYWHIQKLDFKPNDFSKFVLIESK